MLPAYQQLPPAIVAAREDEALTHGQVLYGLIKPTTDMDQVESTAAMVNVIPKKRIYRMENPEEIDLFMTELMKRPLVLQPSAYIGRGLAMIRCAFYTKEERWVMLINQAHPKVYSRIQMGIEIAKSKMNRGEPFILEISFNAYLKKVYLSRLTKAVLNETLTFIDFEDAEIVIRYPGDRYHRGMQWQLTQTTKIRFEFEDLLPSDVTRRTVMAAQSEWSNPALRVIMPDELKTVLPGWNFEDIDPLAGVVYSDDEDSKEEGAIGGIEMAPHDVQPSAPPDGKIVGRAKRKAIDAGMKIEVPIELHIREPHGPQTLFPPSSPYGGRSPSHNYNGPVQMSGTRLSPQMNHSPYGAPSQNPPRTPVSPRMTVSPRTPVSPHVHEPSPGLRGAPKSPMTHRQVPTTDRYNTEHLNTRQSQQTYLTDDDDGGFSHHSPNPMHVPPGSKYDTNSHQLGADRYGPNNNPRDRYADQQMNRRGPNTQARPNDLHRSNPSPQVPAHGSERLGPVPAPRGFHRHQGSGRSDTSTSDSGFGENENGHDSSVNRLDRNNGVGYNGVQHVVKTPYYNRAFEKDSPDKEHSAVDDIMAKHKAMAAGLMHKQDHSAPNSNRDYKTQNYYNDSNYNRELQKWRQNINDLEEDAADFSRTRLRMNSHEEPMEESFI